MLRTIKSKIRFLADERGSMTLLGLYLGGSMFILGGMAVDVSNLVTARTQLQVAADFAAHAALYERQYLGAAAAKQEAVDLVAETFPSHRFGTMLSQDDIHFGYYDAGTQGFQVDESSTEAVFVKTDRLASQGNPVTGYLTRLIGYDHWDVVAPSVFVTYRPACLRDGWVGDSTVDAQSNNYFTDRFCIHSNTQVEFNSGSTFEAGVEVSAPGGYADIVVPSSGYDSNTGLYDAVVPEYYNLRILTQLPTIKAGLTNPDSEYFQDYITDTLPITLPSLNLAATDFLPGHIYTYDCALGQTMFIDAVPAIANVILDTDCKVSFSQGSAVENSVIWTENTSDKSVTAPNGLRLGANDGCDSANSVKVVTYGGFEVAQNLQIYGSQVIAKGPIQFAAAADGVEGGSFISGETIDGTSNTTMGVCPNDGGEVFEVDLFRLAG